MARTLIKLEGRLKQNEKMTKEAFFQKDNFNFKELRRRAEISRRGWEMQET